MVRKTLIFTLLVLLALPSQVRGQNSPSQDNDLLRPGTQNPEYWCYHGQETLLLGGSIEDNLFQVENVEQHLELLRSVGGNYVRCTMSSRDEGNEWPFAKNEEGLYDLYQFNETYWNRFQNFLEAARDRGIVVQVEVWATFDFYRDNWDVNPFNPLNNVNYTTRRSRLPEKVETHPTFTENNFFRSVPAQMALPVVLQFQQVFVDKLLDISLAFDNVLYCMDNETSVSSDWGKFWARYIRKRAAMSGKTVFTTEMWDPWDLDHPFHAETFDNPDIFTFVDISQNNHNSGDRHWFNGLKQFERLKFTNSLRPVNNVKIYGNDGGKHQTTRNAVESFVKNVLMGCASARFHRPTSGQGLNETAQHVIRSMREMSERSDFFAGQPTLDPLTNRVKDEQYCRAVPGREYLVYFTRKGEVQLELTPYDDTFSLSWLNILESRWIPGGKVTGGSSAELKTPGDGHWIALVTRDN